MKVKTSVKAGGRTLNHNQSFKGLRVKSSVKAGTGNGGLATNHNQTVKGLRVMSSVKAGEGIRILNHNQTVAR